MNRRTSLLIIGSLVFPPGCGSDDPTDPFGTLSVTTTTLPGGVRSVAYSATLSAGGGDGARTWAVSTGSLPQGLTLTAESGAIGGTPSSAGGSTFTIQVTSGGQTATRQLTLTVNGPPDPFGGTIFVDPDIITASDPTAFQMLSVAGQASRTMFDRRVNSWITVDAYLFDATFDDGFTVEVQVNPEFGSSGVAQAEAQKYAVALGRLPTALRDDMETVWIHKGIEPFGGGNRNVLIHTGQADLYTADGILEETLVHEAAHTSLDADHASAPAWLAAQSADGTFISAYARDFPNREDIAESFLLYLAVRFRSDRITQSLADTILLAIPNRIDYFDDQAFDMYPIG